MSSERRRIALQAHGRPAEDVVATRHLEVDLATKDYANRAVGSSDSCEGAGGFQGPRAVRQQERFRARDANSKVDARRLAA